MLLSLYIEKFHDEITVLVETGQAGLEDKETLIFLVNLMLSGKDPQPQKAIELAALAINRCENEERHSKLIRETFVEIVSKITEKKLLCRILDNLPSASDATLEAFESAILKDKQDRKYYVLFLIFTNRLTEAASLNQQLKNEGIKDSMDNLIELLLVGRENSMPATFKFLNVDPDLGRLHSLPGHRHALN